MSGPYDLYPVKVGKEVIHARPIAWDREHFDGQGNDVDGAQVDPIRWQGVCPDCGQLLEFGASDILENEEEKYDAVECEPCGNRPEGFRLRKTEVELDEESANRALVEAFVVQPDPVGAESPFQEPALESFSWFGKVNQEITV